MLYQENKEIIIEALNNYFHINKDNYDNDKLFDELFFLILIKRRYKKQLIEFGREETYREIENRYKKVNKLLKVYFENKRKKLKNETLYKQSQVIFNLLGYMYINKVEKEDLSKDEKNIIEKSFGYSAIFDFMSEYFIQRLKININKPILNKLYINVSKEEKIYIDTHYFLLKSEYFTKKCDDNNIDELVKDYKYAIDNNLGDLVAEIFWALNYFKYDNKNVMKQLENYLQKNYNDGQWNFSYDNLRKHIHSQYSAIIAYLELLKNRSENYE